MSVVVRSALSLQSGCKLLYDPPLRGEDFESERFFKEHRDKQAAFVGYSEKMVGVLDYKGRLPGRYINPECIKVKFVGEEARNLNIRQFVVIDKHLASVTDLADDDQRLGDLLHPILFYPDDLVRFKKKPSREVTREPKRIRGVFMEKPFTMDGRPRYEVMETDTEYAARAAKLEKENEKRSSGKRLILSSLMAPDGWNTRVEDIKLVSRGNVWALYESPDSLSFESDEEESTFWARDGISKTIYPRNKDTTLGRMDVPDVDERSLESAYQGFLIGIGDVISVSELKQHPDAPDRYHVHCLHDCFEEHRDGVRALTGRVWAHQVKQSVA